VLPMCPERNVTHVSGRSSMAWRQQEAVTYVAGVIPV
jgi:hypothetical protein